VRRSSYDATCICRVKLGMLVSRLDLMGPTVMTLAVLFKRLGFRGLCSVLKHEFSPWLGIAPAAPGARVICSPNDSSWM
jgi:hypothetical protein